MLPFASIAEGQYDIIEDETYLELMSHMYMINTESSREKLLTGKNVFSLGVKKRPPNIVSAIQTCVGVVGQALGRWDRCPSPYMSYHDFSALYYELTYLQFRLEAS